MSYDFVRFQSMPFSIGLEVEGNRVLRIIEKGSVLPVESRNIFTTIVRNQFAAEIHLVKGESYYLEKTTSMARILFPGIPCNRISGQIHLRTRLEIMLCTDMHGFSEISIKDMDTGLEQFTLLSDLSDEELQAFSFSPSKQDMLEGKVYNLIASLKQQLGFLDYHPVGGQDLEIREVLHYARAALVSHDTGSLSAAQVYLETHINELYTLTGRGE